MSQFVKYVKLTYRKKTRASLSITLRSFDIYNSLGVGKGTLQLQQGQPSSLRAVGLLLNSN